MNKFKKDGQGDINMNKKKPKIKWYDTRYLTCPSCRHVCDFFHLKDVKEWVEKHHKECGATSFKEEGYVEVIE